MAGTFGISTSDGVVDFEVPARVEIGGENVARVGIDEPWVTPSAFVGLTEIADVDFGTADYVSLDLGCGISDGQVDGSFDLDVWEDFESRYFHEYPTLRWCSGSGCEQYWCSYTSDNPDVECSQ